MLVQKRGYYLLKAVMFFAFNNKDTFSTKELSKRLGITEKVLEQVLLSLKNMGILARKRGPKGGYRLSRDVSGWTVMDILDMAGKKLDVFPVDTGVNGKAIDDLIKKISSDVEKDIYSRLKEFKVADLVDQMREKVAEKGLSYVI